MRLEVSVAAEADINAMYAIGATNFGLDQADRYMAGLLSVLSTIADNPMIGRVRDEVRPPIRLFPYEAHHVFYDVVGDTVVIQRLLHGSADWTSEL